MGWRESMEKVNRFVEKCDACGLAVIVTIIGLVAIFGDDKEQNFVGTDGPVGLLWQSAIAFASVYFGVKWGVPFAMEVNRKNREEEKKQELSDFCFTLHLYLQDYINQIDHFPYYMTYGIPPPPLSLEFFEQPEWFRRHVLIKNRPLVTLMQHMRSDIQFLNSYLSDQNPLKTDEREKWLVYVWDLGIGVDLNEKYRELISAGERMIRPQIINQGMNRDFICLTYSLQNFMSKNKIPFEKWNEERIEAVLEIQRKSPRFLPGQEGSDCLW